ncbi:flavoprotein NADH-dependent oxidoreductase [Coprinopsis sp. MPI-PUGE-AT-0042]|nr:flavoprotein NADH-dependent oxidoreductase [Coprinopsis sp. MPI-PUGE-AT-0042]
MVYKALFTPLRIGTITVPNRVQMTAMTRNRAPNAVPNDLMKEYYVQRAKGGAGLIVSDGILIVRQGTAWQQAPGIWNDEQVRAWKAITDAVHAEGGYIYAQLWHLGRLSHPDAPEQKLAGTPVYAPSAISARGGKFRFIEGEPGNVTPTAVDDPTVIIQQFKQAAINAKEAGFDGVEVHGCGGYLVNQFLDLTANKRTDKWGGSVENRSRFGLETLKALKEVFGDNVAIKLSPAGGVNDIGMPLEDSLETYRYFIAEADKLGLSYFCFQNYVAMFDVPIDGKRRGAPHDYIESYRHLIQHAKVFINADVTPEDGAKLIEAKKVDGLGLGRLWISHPDVVNRLKHGVPLDNQLDFMTLYDGKPVDGEDGINWRIGFTGYPAADIAV